VSASAIAGRPWPTIAVLTLVIVAGLVVDRHVPVHGQLLTDLGVWCVFGAAVWRASPDHRRLLLVCLLFATLGECLLALVWGLYEYRLGNLPLFVPPGHALLLRLGMLLAPLLPGAIGRWVPWLAAPVVLGLGLAGIDTFGVLLFAGFALACRRQRTRQLYAVMFVLALGLELLGTWLGNWRWAAQVPWLGLSTCNPPLAAGVFYCVLDGLVLGTRRWWRADARSGDARPRSAVDGPREATTLPG
jgi:hypothetical protein